MLLKRQMTHHNQCSNVSIRSVQTALNFKFRDLLFVLPDSYTVFSNTNTFTELKPSSTLNTQTLNKDILPIKIIERGDIITLILVMDSPKSISISSDLRNVSRATTLRS